eukprot:jgi/Picre1/35919/NNA_003376.t1
MVYIAAVPAFSNDLIVNFLFRLHIKNIEMQRSIALKGAPSHQRVVRVTGSRVNRRGGTLSGAAAAGKDASDKFKAMAEGVEISGPVMQITEDGKFRDYRWSNGRWDMNSAAFKGSDGEIDWDLVIDAEMARRKLLEDTPIPSTNEEPVLFDTAEIPWWAWESFLGKLALHICVFGVLFVRNVADIDSIKNLIDEATFYDKQWTATWENQERPDEE